MKLVNESGKVSLKDMTFPELREWMTDIGEKRFRADQLFRRLYQGAVTPQEITEFSGALRSRLESVGDMTAVSMLRKQVSKDGTRKYLFGVRDGLAIESVFMKYKYGNTACISSQAGCRMGCAFCASGIGGLERNLTAGEMADQIVAMERDTGERIGHIVVMGTGEPFDNYDQLLRFIEIVHDERGLNIGMRNITVSTCGILKRIKQFAEDMPSVNLAISLHAPEDELRRKIMPVAKGYEMSELLEACRYHEEKTHRRTTFEYALMKGVNDSDEHAAKLASLLKGMLCHVNLIPLNYVEEKGMRGTERKNAERFAEILDSRGIEVTIRRELGSDISAACGQLRLENRG